MSFAATTTPPTLQRGFGNHNLEGEGRGERGNPLSYIYIYIIYDMYILYMYNQIYTYYIHINCFFCFVSYSLDFVTSTPRQEKSSASKMGDIAWHEKVKHVLTIIEAEGVG